MNKRIKIELTEDQVSRVVVALENDMFLYSNGNIPLTDYEIGSDAFTLRLINSIKEQRSRSI